MLEREDEARERATSVYMVDRTIPMLPEILSTDLCSLNPNEDRLSMSAVFELDSEARIVSKWFGEFQVLRDVSVELPRWKHDAASGPAISRKPRRGAIRSGAITRSSRRSTRSSPPPAPKASGSPPVRAQRACAGGCTGALASCAHRRAPARRLRQEHRP